MGFGDGVGLFQVGLVVFLVDVYQYVVDFDYLVVFDFQVGYLVGYVWCYYYYVGLYLGIVGLG